jgi:signal transduction histidine kinase
MVDKIDQLNLLRAVASATAKASDPAQVARAVAEVVVKSVGADVCFVHMVDLERRRISLIGATPPFDLLTGTIELAIGDGVAGWVAETGEVAIVPDKWKDRRYRYIPELKGENFVSLVSVPMKRGPVVVGVLNVHWAKELTDFSEVAEILSVVGSLLAPSLESTLLLDRLAKREHELARFAQVTIDSQESERKRIATDLHDGIGQGLLSLLFHLDAAEGAAFDDPASVISEISRAKELANRTFEEARDSIRRLRPGVLDDLGLRSALESLFRVPGGLISSVDVDDVRLESHLEIAIFRVCQEALSNVLKHSHANSVAVKLRISEDEVVLSVSDDGVGFDSSLATSEDHFGLLGMRERAELFGGKFEIYSKVGFGTRLTFKFPNHPSPAN